MKWLFLALALVGAAVSANDERGALFLARQRYASEAITLPLASGDMTVLQRSPTVPNKRGNALLFADIGSDPERSARIAALRVALNDSGWHTWAVIPPPAPNRSATISPAGPGSEPPPAVNPEKADEWLVGNQSSELLTELKSSLGEQLARLRQELPKGGFQIIIAEGMSAPLLAELLAAGDIPKADALIVMGPYLPVSAMNKAVGDTLAAVQIPLLDLVMPEDHRLALANPDSRVIAARLAYLPHYRQRRLALSATANSQAMVDEVSAFLRYLGW